MPPRPPSITVLAILGIILGAFTFVSLMASILFLVFTWNRPSPALDPFRGDTLYLTYSIISTTCALILSLLLISASTGSLKLRPWARRGMLLYACLKILHVSIGAVFTITYIFPKMAATMAPAGLTPAGKLMTLTLISTFIGFVISATLPILILCFFTRPRAKDAFNGIFPPISNFPVQFP